MLHVHSDFFSCGLDEIPNRDPAHVLARARGRIREPACSNVSNLSAAILRNSESTYSRLISRVVVRFAQCVTEVKSVNR